MQSILDFFHSTVGLPWAWSIVALTILVRILLVPLTVRQIHSMQSLQAHAPEMKEIQRKYKGDRTKLNEELMKFYKENHINPAASCLPLLAQFPVFIALYFVLKHFSNHIRRALVAAHRPEHLGEGDVALVGLPAARDLRRLSQIASTYFMGATMDKTQRRIMMVLPLIFITFVAQLPDRPDHLLDDDEPLDGRPGPRHPPARAEAERGRQDAGAGRPEAVLADAGEGRRDRQRRRDRDAAPGGDAARAAAASQAEEEAARAGERRGLRRGNRRDRRRGEVEGAARPRARRARARQGGRPLPGGLRGRARPARRRLHARPRDRQRLHRRRRGAARLPHATTRATSRRGCASSSRPSSARWASRHASTCTRRRTESPSTCSGGDLGLLIGKHGQTIDALQYVANAVVVPLARRQAGDDRRRGLPRPPPRDAGGDRPARRRAGGATGEQVRLEPMTAVERKVVHERLKDVGGVETSSEGDGAESLRRRLARLLEPGSGPSSRRPA